MNKLIFIFVSIAIIIVVAFWGICVEPNSLKLTKVEVDIPEFSKEANVKVGIISDLHIGIGSGDYERIEKAVELVNKEKPDIIVNLGDYHSYTIAKSGMDSKKISEILSRLKAKYGVYSILGNHDGIFIHNFNQDGSFKTLEYQRRMVENLIKNSGIQLLDDSYKALDIRGNKFVLIGLTDKYSNPKTYIQQVLANKVEKANYPNLNRIMKEIPKNMPVILLNHAPDVFPDVPDRAGITLSGHTHGGHINLPIIRDLLTPSIYSGRYVKGLYKEGNKKLFVTTGVGGIPLRINTPPEVVIVTLKGK